MYTTRSLSPLYSPVHTGDYSRRIRSRQFWRESPNSATVAGFGDSRRIRQQSPVLATVAEFGDYSRQCGQGVSLTLLKCLAYILALSNR